MALKLAPIQIVKNTGSNHTGTVIFFHGSGDSAPNFKNWVGMTLRKEMNFSQIKVMYPNAPSRPYTPNGGNMSNVWFDRLGINPFVPEHIETLDEMGEIVKALIKEEEKAGIPLNRIVVGGFSMGGALAYHIAYRWLPDVAGVFAISSFLNEDSAVYKNISTNTTQSWPNLIHLHGDSDYLVPSEWGKKTFDNIMSYNVKGKFHILPKIDHALSGKGIRLIQKYIEDLLPDL